MKAEVSPFIPKLLSVMVFFHSNRNPDWNTSLTLVGSGLLIDCVLFVYAFTRPAHSFTMARANSVSATRRQLQFSSGPPHLASCLPALYCQLAILLGSVSVRVSLQCVGLWACLGGGKTPLRMWVALWRAGEIPSGCVVLTQT